VNERRHCTCVEVRNYRYEQAAEKLGCTTRFLEDNVQRFVHQRIGGKRVFCECELKLIQRQLTVVPDQAAEKAPADDAPATPELTGIRPRGRRQVATR